MRTLAVIAMTVMLTLVGQPAEAPSARGVDITIEGFNAETVPYFEPQMDPATMREYLKLMEVQS